MTDRINGPTFEPELYDLLERNKRDTMNSINCIKVGKIVKYTALTNSAEISIASKRKLADGTIADYPILGDCPVFVLKGGTSFISCPITPGDECIVLFSDRSIDNWYLAGQVLPPMDTRCHSLSDGIAIVGIQSLANVKLTPASSVCINGGTYKVSIKNAGANLKIILDALIDAISALTVTCTAPGSPSSPPINVAAFALIKTQLALLLDEGLT